VFLWYNASETATHNIMNTELSTLLDHFHGIEIEMEILGERITNFQRKSDIDKFDKLEDEYYEVYDRIFEIHNSKQRKQH